MKIERKPMKLGDILVAHKIASEEDINSAVAEQKENGGKLGDILVRRGIASKEDIFWALSNQFNISYMPIDKNQIDREIVRVIPEEIARKHNILPLLKVANDLVIVVDDPMQFSVFDDVEKLTGLNVNLCLGKSEEIVEALDHVYGKQMEKITDETIEVLDAVFSKDEIENLSKPRAETLLKKLLHELVRVEGDALHIDKTKNWASVRCRLDGVLKPWLNLPLDLASEIATRIRIFAGMGAVAESYQEGTIDFEYDGKALKSSVVIVQVRGGESIVVRPVPSKKKIPELRELGLTNSQLKELKGAASLKRGMIISAGPRDSGKTTTLRALLKGSGKNKVVILESDSYFGDDKIALGVSNAEELICAFDSALKTDPDAIIIEPSPTVKIIEKAVYASLESVKVGIQLSLPDAFSVISYLMEMDIPHSALASAVNVIVAQRLVRKLCEHCKKPSVAPKGLELRGADVFEPVGCAKCALTGYSGKTTIFEVVVLDSRLRSIIASHLPPDELYELLQREKIAVLKERALELFADGLTSAEEIAEFI